jgi:sugar phosphate isomerase/epimerase
MNRREFIEKMSAAGAVACAAGSYSFAVANAQSPHVNFPTDPRRLLAISAWAIRFLIDAPQNDERDPKLPAMDMKDFGAYVSEKFKVTNIEPYNGYFRTLEKSGTRAVNIAADMDTSYFDADAATRAKSVAEAKKWIDVAVAIGAPSVRTSMSSVKNPPNLDHATESLKPVADYAASRNVVVHLENDNLVYEDAFFIEKIVRKVNHPYVRALPDFGNSYGSGDPAFAARAVKALFPLAYAISHVKPTATTQQGKEMQVDLAANFAAAKAANYKGYFSMEYEGKEEIHAATARLIDQSLKLMQR